MKLGGIDPYLGEAEFGMRYEREAGLVHLGGPIEVVVLQFFVNGVVNPKIDVSLPVLFLLCWRDVGHCPLVNISHGGLITVLLLQLGILEPSVVIERVVLDTFGILCPLLGEDDIFDALPISVLLLEGNVRLVQLLPLDAFLLGNFLVVLHLL